MMKYLVMDGVKKCGGSVIADKFVATASHCIRTCPDHCSQDWDRCADTPSCYVKLRSATVGTGPFRIGCSAIMRVKWSIKGCVMCGWVGFKLMD